MRSGKRSWFCWGTQLGVCLLALAVPSPLSSQPVIVLNDGQQEYVLGYRGEILADACACLSLEDVLAPELASRFVPCRRRTPNFGYTKSAYWLRFRVRNEASSRSPWVVQLNFPNIDRVDLYVLSEAGEIVAAKKSGRMQPLAVRDHPGPNPVFLIPFSRERIETVYLRFQSEESLTLPLVLLSMTRFVSQLGASHLGHGMFLGILAALILYNLFLFSSLKDRNYLFFLLCLTALLFFTVSSRGLGLRFLWPEALAFNKLSLPLSLGLLVLALLKFADGFLTLRKDLPALHRLSLVLMAITGAVIAAIPFTAYARVIRPVVLLGIADIACITAASILAFARGFRPARYLLLGFSILAAGGISFLLVRLGILPSAHVTEMGFSFGNLVLILLMALALADRIKILQADKERSDRHLQESEEQRRILSRAMEQSPALILLTDLNGDIEYVNPRFCEVTGYSPEEVKGKNPRLLKSGLTPASVYRQMWEAITAGETWRGELRNRKKNGELYWENAFLCPVKDESGRATHYLGLKEDISEHKELQEQLFQVQKMDSIGTLAGGIAHDFNNILTVIKGHADLARAKTEKTHPVARSIAAIHSASERAENLIRQILAFSRKQVYLPQAVDINRVLAELKSMLARLISEDIRIEMSLSPDLPPISADPNQIERIFVNLVVNARDAIQQKTGKATERTITVETGTADLDGEYARTHVGTRPGRHVFFSISDTGIGIDAEHRSRIFEPFFTTKSSGTGLGLATVYGIVKQNNANIYVYSEPGKGSTFRIYWPVSAEAPVVPARETLESADLRGGEKILLAEDDRGIAELAGRVLREAGYRVRIARDGNQALKGIGRGGFCPDLLVSDLVMPGISGKELSERVRAACPGVRVLFSSGYADNHLVRNGQLEHGMDFLQKPYSAVDLLRAIRRVLDKPPGAVAGA